MKMDRRTFIKGGVVSIGAASGLAFLSKGGFFSNGKMNEASGLKGNHFDVIIAGSGSAGATLARELSKRNKRVLILERGETVALKETVLGVAEIMDEVPVTDELKDMRAITTGGSTALYFGVAKLPPLDLFQSLGIDLSAELREAMEELPVAELPDGMLGAQVLKLRDSAMELGYAWKKNPMLIHQSKAASGYDYDAKWKAKTFVEEAVRNGATLITGVEVTKAIVEGNQAVGVEFKVPARFGGEEKCQAFGSRIVLAAGVLASPLILRNSGIRNVANRGFSIDPNSVLFGSIPGLGGKNSFIGSMEAKLDADITLGDANLHRMLYKMVMLFKLKVRQFSAFQDSIAIGIKVRDSLGGEMLANGSYRKDLTDDVLKKIKKGEEVAAKILRNAGAKDIFSSGINATGTGGVLRIQEHVDANLQTEIANLHVCDRSVLPDAFRDSPTLTLVCLAKYLSKQILTTV